MQLILSNNNGVATMSSLEMVDYINSTRESAQPKLLHKDFMGKIAKVLSKPSAIQFAQGQVAIGSGAFRTINIAHFPKREAMLMAMSYSYDLQAKVYDAWEAAEQAVLTPSPVFVLPNFNNPAEAARAWADQVDIVTETKLALTYAQEEIAQAAPIVEAFKAISEDSSTMTLGEAAKILNIKPHKFTASLRSMNYLMSNNVPYQSYVNSGYFYLKYSNYTLPNGSAPVPTTLVTSKGLLYLQKKFAENT